MVVRQLFGISFLADHYGRGAHVDVHAVMGRARSHLVEGVISLVPAGRTRLLMLDARSMKDELIADVVVLTEWGAGIAYWTDLILEFVDLLEHLCLRLILPILCIW